MPGALVGRILACRLKAQFAALPHCGSIGGSCPSFLKVADDIWLKTISAKA